MDFIEGINLLNTNTVLASKRLCSGFGWDNHKEEGSGSGYGTGDGSGSAIGDGNSDVGGWVSGYGDGSGSAIGDGYGNGSGMG